jgi:hypothetical protein
MAGDSTGRRFGPFRLETEGGAAFTDFGLAKGTGYTGPHARGAKRKLPPG